MGEKIRPTILARDVRKQFGTVEVLRGVNLEVAPSEVVVLLGSSGSGKSTFLRCINQLEEIDGGWIEIDGEPAGYRVVGSQIKQLSATERARQRRNLGMVFQQFNLFAHLTALQNIIEAPISVLGMPRARADEEGRELLARVGLADKADLYPYQLSGGQQQRVAIARALAMGPKVMLFDEPTSALDPELVGEVLGVMKSVAQSGTTMLVVTHEMTFAREVADRVCFMDQGIIIQSGNFDSLLTNPASQKVASFVKQLESTGA